MATSRWRKNCNKQNRDTSSSLSENQHSIDVAKQAPHLHDLSLTKAGLSAPQVPIADEWQCISLYMQWLMKLFCDWLTRWASEWVVAQPGNQVDQIQREPTVEKQSSLVLRAMVPSLIGFKRLVNWLQIAQLLVTLHHVLFIAQLQRRWATIHLQIFSKTLNFTYQKSI